MRGRRGAPQVEAGTARHGTGGGEDGAAQEESGTAQVELGTAQRGACESLVPSALAILARPQLSVYKRK